MLVEVITILLLAFILFIISLYVYKWIKDYIILRKLPGPPREGLIIGNMSHFWATPDEIHQRLRQCAKDFFPIYKVYAVHRVGANIVNPEDAELVLSNPVHNKKGQIYNVLHKWLKQGLLTSFGPQWQTRRKILTPAFHFNVLQEFIKIFNEEAENLVEILKKESRGKPHVNVSPIIDLYTLKIITETSMGVKLQFRNKKEIDYKQAIYDIGVILTYRLIHPWCIETLGNFLSPHYFKERSVTKVLHQFTKDVIEEREKHFSDIELPKEEHDVYKGKKRLAMLDLLLSAKNKDRVIDDKGIHEEVDTFTFEGHDTTSEALGFLLMLLACNRESQDKIYEEMCEVIGDLRKKPSYIDLLNLKFMERCIKESLRLYPSVYMIARTLGEDLKTHSNYLLPKETTTVIHIYDIHHNPDIYPDPEKFDPDRFLPENSQKRHKFAYLPFSAGPRNCIGQKFALLELKATLCAILGYFILEPIDTPESIVVKVDIILRTKDGINVKFVPRF